MAISIQKARELLGAEAIGKSDAQLQNLLDALNAMANTFYDDVQTAWRRDPESVRWLAHASQTGETE